MLYLNTKLKHPTKKILTTRLAESDAFVKTYQGKQRLMFLPVL